MTAPVKQIRTSAELELVERFAKVRDLLPGSDKVQAVRETAFALFERQGLPHRRVEEWKYSDLRARLKTVAPVALKPDSEFAGALLRTYVDPFDGMDRYRLVLVDGYFDMDASERDALLGEGVEVAGLRDLLEMGGDMATELLANPETGADDIAVSLNSAFATDGVVILIPEGTRLSKPIEILSLASAAAPAAIHLRNRILVGNDVDATILEVSSGGTSGSEINLFNEYRVGDGVTLTVARLQETDVGATHIASNFVSLGEKTDMKHLSVESGAGFSRNQTFLGFAGQHSRAEILGVSMLHDDRHIDQTLVVDHAVPNCESGEIFKTVADDRSSGVFQGKIVVRPDAQKTNGKMMSQALLLSEEAQMAAKPELEIYADDVVCGHGATSGQIDASMLFYLMARGIPRAEAERLLIEAFLADAVDAIDREAIADVLKQKISDWLSTRKDARVA